jgi:hypothetical protein
MKNLNVELILSFVLAICTVVYTIINVMLWVESKATRKQKLTPLMVTFLKSAENHIMLELHIKNIGEGLAKNVRVKVHQDYKQFGKDDFLLSDVGIIKNGFNTFPPEYELKFYIDSLVKLYEKDKDGSIKLEFNYESYDKRHFQDIYDLPFNQIFGQNYSTPPETYAGQIPYYLKEINSTLKKINERES